MSILDEILSIPSDFIGVVFQLAYAFVYPLVKVANFVSFWIATIVSEFMGLVDIFIQLYNLIHTMLFGILGSMFPSAWVTLFFISIAVAAGFRILQLAGHVSIAGFKI